MVIFEGKAFNEKLATRMEIVEVGKRAELRLDLGQERSIFWHYTSPETAISKMNDIVILINERENEILKLKG